MPESLSHWFAQSLVVLNVCQIYNLGSKVLRLRDKCSSGLGGFQGRSGWAGVGHQRGGLRKAGTCTDMSFVADEVIEISWGFMGRGMS